MNLFYRTAQNAGSCMRVLLSLLNEIEGFAMQDYDLTGGLKENRFFSFSFFSWVLSPSAASVRCPEMESQG